MSQRPDAVFIPETYKGDGETQYQRIDNLANITDEILKVSKEAGEFSHIRKQPGGQCFVTRDPHDTILHPNGHPKVGQERYRWEDHPTLKGVKVGYFIEEPAVATA